MNDLMERDEAHLENLIEGEKAERVLPAKSEDTKPAKLFDRFTRRQLVIGAITITAILLVASVWLFTAAYREGTAAAAASFQSAKAQSADEAYRHFYDKSYTAAEKAHHVSNRVSITVGKLREEQKLEVLRVSDVAYETPRPKDQSWFNSMIAGITGIFASDVVSWLEVPGSGVFTVNLQAGEFIMDDARQYVLIRLPAPELTEFAIDYENVELLLFEEGGAFKNSAKYGVDKAMEQLQSAELTMMQNLNNNQEFYKRAREAAEQMLVNLVRQLNPALPELTVEVEFID